KNAVKTQALAAKARPSANSYYQLAQFAYAGGEVSKGDRAAAEAIRRTPKDLRNSVRAQVKDIKKQGAQLAKAIKTQEKASKKAAKSQPGGSSFGPLPGATALGHLAASGVGVIVRLRLPLALRTDREQADGSVLAHRSDLHLVQRPTLPALHPDRDPFADTVM